jgi:D-alanyl-D-alanine carboxypeptidase/D-alanyl-D-alanine-endopeptidase (penicillin-binding protein 4)
MKSKYESPIGLRRNACRFSGAVLAGLFLWLVAPPARGQETNRIQSLAGLRQKIAAFLTQPRFGGALWGVKIVSLDTGKTLFEHHPDRLMSPASNCKLFTGALALDRFGGDYRISTPIYATANVNRSGTVHGDLIIVGHGDPSWNERRLGTNFWDLFEPFVAVLTNVGVRRVTGDLVADASFFHGEPTGSSWMIDDLQDGDVADLSALTLDDNLAHIRVEPGASNGAPGRLTLWPPLTGLVLSNSVLTVSTNGRHHVEVYYPLGKKTVYVFGQLPVGGTNEILDVPVPQPAGWFAAGLKEALARQGIKISGAARSVAWPQTPAWNPATAVKLGEVLSPPLREVIRGFMKPSQNLETDLLLAHVGEMTRASNAPPWRTSEESGLAALHQFLAASGLPAGEVHFDEGSGLSDDNLTTANSTVALLAFMAGHRDGQDFINALPIAGVDGTLQRRMKNTPADGNVRAKTGTLRWANSLSGYVTSAAGERLAFSLMLNRYAQSPDSNKREELDAIAVMLAEFAGRSDDPASLEKTYAPFGQLVVTQLTTAPFPHPARAQGYTYHDKFYSAQEHYSNSCVVIFIPKGFRPTEKVDFVVHFHGWNHTVAGTLDEYKLIGQFADSGRNAILIVPQGPYNAPDSFGGKLEDTNGFKNFMDEVAATVKDSGALAQTNFAIGNIILSGHSGGYRVIAAILDHGGLSEKVREVWLFDALYGGTESFVAWQKAENGRLLDIYTDHGGTKEETENLMASLKTNGVVFFAAEDTNATLESLLTNKLVFLHSDMNHGEVIAKRGTFEQFLKSSCLENQ